MEENFIRESIDQNNIHTNVQFKIYMMWIMNIEIVVITAGQIKCQR